MKRFITILLSFLFISFQSAKAEMGIGLTGAFHMFDVSGTETTRSSGEKNNGSHDEDVGVLEIFAEAMLDNGSTVGVAYIPTRDMGSKSRSDTNSEGDTGTYKAAAELDNVIQFYTDIALPNNVLGSSLYVKVGVQHATITTLESLNSGSTYPDQDVLGYTIGFGTKGDLAGNMYYKGEVTYTNFEQYEATSNGNRIEADLDDYAAKFSIGYKF